MSVEKSPEKNCEASHIQAVLSKANIYVVGGLSKGQSLIRDLYKAGARKITLVNVDLTEDMALSENNALSTSGKDKIFEKTDIEWTIANIEKLIQQSDIVIDVLTDWQKKLTLSDICMESEKVLIHSGITGFRFQIYTMIPGRSACLRCALPLAGIDEVPMKPIVETTMDAVIELVDAWLSLESIKYLTKIGVVQGNELFKFDCLSGEFEVIRGLDGDPDCPDCGRKISRRIIPEF